ncbi:MAG: hypothetical protein K0B15_14750 [Lentimicrobium sp.]|nr:hypothetical protein [Lentimicrobium sp.]
MLRILFSVSIILLLLNNLSAQEVYSVKKEGAWEFGYSPLANSNRINNQIVNQLALVHKKIIEKTSFTFHYNFQLALEYIHDGQLDVNMVLNPDICKGDVHIRDFNLSELLVPGKCQFRTIMYNVFGEPVFETPFLEMQIANLKSGAVIASFPDSLWNDGNRLHVDFISFNFTEVDYRLFEFELNSIMNYYAAVSLSDTLERRVRKARVSAMSPSEAFGAVVFNSKSMRLLDDALQTKTLLTPGRDPGQLFNTVSVNRFMTSELKGHLLSQDILKANLGNVYLSLADAYIATLQDVLKITQNIDHQSIPFYYRLFSNCLSLSQINAMGKLLNGYATKYNHGRVDLRLISLRILQALEDYATELMADGRFAEAVDVLSSGEKFALANPAVFVPESLTEMLRQARSGLTFSYTSVVQKALAKKLPDLAHKYMDEAEQYAEKYKIAELQSTGLSALYQQMADQHIAKANASLMKKDYRDAIAEFEKAYQLHKNKTGVTLNSTFNSGLRKAVDGAMAEILTNAGKSIRSGDDKAATDFITEAISFSEFYSNYYPDHQSIDSLKAELAELQYSRLLNAAFSAKRDFHAEEAMHYMKQAAGLRSNFALRPSEIYDTLLVKVVIPQLNALYSKGRLRLWAGKPEEALTIAGEVDYLAGIFELSSEPSISDQQKELIKQAEASLCSRLKGEFESLVNEVDDLLSKNRFEAAEPVIAEARELIFHRPFCGLSAGRLNEVIGKHRHAISWNKMQKESLLLIELGNYTEGISGLQKAEAVFNHYRLDTLGLMNTGFLDLAMKTDQLPLIQYSTDYYIGHNLPDKALVLLDRMRLAGVSAEQAKAQQESLGRVMAMSDLVKTDDPDTKILLRNYTGGNKWYRLFTEVYLYHIQNR